MDLNAFKIDAAAAAKINTKATGPAGALPLTPEMLVKAPSGHIFGLGQTSAMLGRAATLAPEILIISTMGGMRADNGDAIAAGLHTGHFELNSLVRRAATTLTARGATPFAVYGSDPCDGRTQGTPGMFDSLPWRNTGAEFFGRLIRSHPTQKGVIGISSCDKGAPATMMALAALGSTPAIFIPGGVMLASAGPENTASIQAIGTRFAYGEVTLEYAQEEACHTCSTPGGGCQFLGTAASSQVFAESVGLSLLHSALAPSGTEIWEQIAEQSADALLEMLHRGIGVKDIITWEAIENSLMVHAAFGCSTNLLLHIAAIAFSAGVKIPTVDDWISINKKIKRLVSVLPNGPIHHPTVRAYLAGGVPEVMLHIRDMGLLHTDLMTVTGRTVGENLDWWRDSERRTLLKERLKQTDGVDAANVIMSPQQASDAGLASTLVFPKGNLAPDGSVIKATAITDDLCPGNVFEGTFSARVFVNEQTAIKAIREGSLKQGDVIILCCIGPVGAGMPEVFQITSSLKYTHALHGIPLITDGRFSGVSTGPCIGHVGPEALAGGPLGKILDGDRIHIRIDRNSLEGQINLVGDKNASEGNLSPTFGDELLKSRKPRSDLKAQEGLHLDVSLFAALVNTTWEGCVVDQKEVIRLMTLGREAAEK